MKRFKVKAPATTANMGAGFDSFGMAFDLFNEIIVEESDKFEISSNIPTTPRTKSNLVYRTISDFCKQLGKPVPTLKITQQDNIPLARGLGSSAACVVSGLLAANHITGGTVSTDDILQIATKIEGHPDNVAPALLGGLVVSATEPSKVAYVKIPPPQELAFTAIIPSFTLATKAARSVLPASYSRQDATFNIARASLFIASILTGKWENIPTALEDKIHQPYRKPLVPGMEEVFTKTRELGAIGVYLSGAGPTIMAITKKENHQQFLTKLNTHLSTLKEPWQAQYLAQNINGALVEEI